MQNSFVLWVCITTEHHPCSLGSLGCNKSLQHRTRAEQRLGNLPDVVVCTFWTALLVSLAAPVPVWMSLCGCHSLAFTRCSQGPRAASSSLPLSRECAAVAELHSEHPRICVAWAEIFFLNCSAVSAWIRGFRAAWLCELHYLLSPALSALQFLELHPAQTAGMDTGNGCWAVEDWLNLFFFLP